jgi:cyclopropane fatty-acyl-phospholipid synthase-like methyltransferase
MVAMRSQGIVAGLASVASLVIALGGAGCSRATHATATTSEPAASDPPGTYMGRTLATPMSYQGADWLDRGDREATEQPEHVLDVLGVKPGMTVADVGAGSGYFTVRIARRIAPNGHVLATDLQPEMLDLLRAKVKEAKLTNVVPVLATESDATLPRGELDLVLMVDVYHELPKPAQTLAQVRAALRPEGRIALVEYRGEDPEVPIKPEHKTTLVQMRRELEANGFMFRSSDESLPQQRIIVFTPSR